MGSCLTGAGPPGPSQGLSAQGILSCDVCMAEAGWQEESGLQSVLDLFGAAFEPRGFRGQGLTTLKTWFLGFGVRELGLHLGSLCSPGQVT